MSAKLHRLQPRIAPPIAQPEGWRNLLNALQKLDKAIDWLQGNGVIVHSFVASTRQPARVTVTPSARLLSLLEGSIETIGHRADGDGRTLLYEGRDPVTGVRVRWQQQEKGGRG